MSTTNKQEENSKCPVKRHILNQYYKTFKKKQSHHNLLSMLDSAAAKVKRKKIIFRKLREQNIKTKNIQTYTL